MNTHQTLRGMIGGNEPIPFDKKGG